MEVPKIPQVSRNYWKFQVTPPNISQKAYVDTNLHLPQVVFQYEMDSEAFRLTKDRYNIPALRAVLNTISSIDAQTVSGNTLLMQSILNNNNDAVTLLVQKGANINLPNEFQVTPLHLASYMNNHEAMIILLEYGATTDNLDSNSMTPLMYAIVRQDNMSVELLVEHGASIDMINKYNMSALSVASEFKSDEILEYLKSKSFDVEIFKDKFYRK